MEPDEKGHESMAPRSSEKGAQLAFRLPKDLVKRLDAHVEQLCRDNPGLDFTRTDAVRSLLTRALDDLDGEKRSRK